MVAISTRVRHAIAVAASLTLLGGCDNDSSNLVSTSPPPTLGSITPDHAAITSLATRVPVTLRGTNFATDATITVSGIGVIVQNVVVSSSTIITATFVIDGTTALGPRDVTVLRPNGRSNAETFTITAERFVDLGLVIRDTRSGLSWEKKTAVGTGGLHDASNTYTWCRATGDATRRQPVWETQCRGSLR